MNYIANLIFMVGILARTGYGNFSSNSKPQNREHKIHNIVLYPDKHSWCKTTAIIQVVGHPGCNSVKIDNNVCVGTCFSYIVPRTVPDTPGDVLPYCDSCQPSHTTWKKVTLECAEGNYKNQNLTKYVEYIHDCNCGSCKDQSAQKLPTEEDLETDDFDSGLISDTFNVTIDGLPWQSNSSSNSSNAGLDVISSLLKKLSNEDENILENTDVKGLHKNVWKKLLQKMESVDGSIDPNVLLSHVKAVEEELKIKFNYKRLKQALFKLKKYQDITKQNSKPDDSLISPQLLQLHNTNKDVLKAEENNTSSKESKDPFASGLYAKLSPSLPSVEIGNETAAPVIDIASQFLKPATGGSEISYHDNLEASNHKIDKKDKVVLN